MTIKQLLEEKLRIERELDAKLEPIVNQVIASFHKEDHPQQHERHPFSYNGFEEGVRQPEVNGTVITFKDEWYYCGDTDFESYTVPITACEDGSKAVYQYLAVERQKRLDREQKQKVSRDRQTELQERLLYTKLKAKFEPEV